MMFKPYCAAVMLYLVLTAAPFQGRSQSVLEKKTSAIADALPKPPDSLDQAVQLYGQMPLGEVPPQFRQALDQLNDMQSTIWKPLYERLDKTTKQNGAGYSPEDQKLLKDVQTMSKTWGEGVMYAFVSRIDYRPGIAKQFWSRPVQPLSAAAQNYYNRLLQIEKDLDCAAFLKQAKEREGVIFQDSRLDDMDKERIQALSEVPMKKIKFAEGSDVMVDLPDPDKTIEVMKRFDARKMEVFKTVYQQQYSWWQTNYTRAAAAAQKLDVILAETQFGQVLSGNDRQMLPAIADVQARVLGILCHLENIGTKMISISQLAWASKQATEDYIKNRNATGGL